MRAFLVTFLVLVVLGAGGWFGYNAMFPLYNIERTYRAGETWEVAINMDISSPVGSLAMPMKVRTRTLKVHSDGSADLEHTYTVEKGMTPLLAAQFKAIDGQSMRVRSDKYAQDTLLGGNIDLGMMNAGTSTNDAYPGKPVRKGSTWERTDTRNGVTVKSVSKVTGTELCKGRECYKIITKLTTVGNNTSQISGTMTTFVDRNTGWALNSSGSMNISSAGTNAVMTVSLDGKRVAPTKKTPPKKQPVNTK